MPKLSAEAQIRSKKAGASESSPRYIAESCMNTHSPPNETRPAAGGRSVMLPQGRLLTAVTSITEPMIPVAEDKSLPVAEERSSAVAGIIPKHSRSDEMTAKAATAKQISPIDRPAAETQSASISARSLTPAV